MNYFQLFSSYNYTYGNKLASILLNIEILAAIKGNTMTFLVSMYNVHVYKVYDLKYHLISLVFNILHKK